MFKVNHQFNCSSQGVFAIDLGIREIYQLRKWFRFRILIGKLKLNN